MRGNRYRGSGREGLSTRDRIEPGDWTRSARRRGPGELEPVGEGTPPAEVREVTENERLPSADDEDGEFGEPPPLGDRGDRVLSSNRFWYSSAVRISVFLRR